MLAEQILLLIFFLFFEMCIIWCIVELCVCFVLVLGMVFMVCGRTRINFRSRAWSHIDEIFMRLFIFIQNLNLSWVANQKNTAWLNVSCAMEMMNDLALEFQPMCSFQNATTQEERRRNNINKALFNRPHKMTTKKIAKTNLIEKSTNRSNNK